MISRSRWPREWLLADDNDIWRGRSANSLARSRADNAADNISIDVMQMCGPIGAAYVTQLITPSCIWRGQEDCPGRGRRISSGFI
ncbi:unnamed protein product [Nezara viridula]|uniref:Uncharacterized protein n=1 Tax=Nezara viridula TaxID=85310 RepID=A0A9P0HKM3_NEZVI|nr:unnamed protein product [Nezara viridula]